MLAYLYQPSRQAQVKKKKKMGERGGEDITYLEI